MSPLLEVTCLGEFTARLEGIALPALDNSKPLALWLYLANEGGPRSRAHLAEFFWGELGDEAARANLRLALLRLRKLLPAHIEISRDSVAVPGGARYTVDLATLTAVEPLTPDGLAGLLRRRPEDLLASLRLRHAPRFDDWVTTTREQLLNRYLSRLSEAAEYLVASRQPAGAVEVLRRCLSLAPWSELHHRLLIDCYARLGQRASALAQLDACRRALREELDAEPGAATLALIQAINALPEQPVDLPVGRAPVPGAGDGGAPFVERPAEHSRLTQLLTDPGCRVVSIVGPGGVGKTHLAQQLTAELGHRFANGACFVSLIDVQPRLPGQAITLVEKRIAEAVGIAQGVISREALLEVLASLELLLVLDNFEQLVEAAELVQIIALRAPRVRVLVTTRRGLRLGTEWIVVLDGLAVPMAREWCEAAAGYPAVELFVKVAERVAPDFEATENGANILQICRAVGGLPLALIIAARWLTTLNCQQIADELDASFRLLSQPGTAGDARAGLGVAAVMDRSFALLTAAEREAFCSLGVFRGGVTADAAVAICGCGLDVLDRLVNQSLVRNRGDGRLTLHELTRDYAAQRLAENPARLDLVRGAHARYYAARLAAELKRFKRDPLNTDFHETRVELSNLVAALDYLGGRASVPPLLALLEGLWAFHKRMGWFADGAALLRRGLAMPDLPLDAGCRLRLWLSDACFQLGHHDEGKEAVLESLARAGEPVPVERTTLFVARELLYRLLPGAPAVISDVALRDDLSRTHNRLAQLYFFEGDRLRFLGSTLRSITAAGGSDGAEHWASGALALAHVPLHKLAARYARRAAQAIGRTEPFGRAWAHEQLALYYLGVAGFDEAEAHAGRAAELFRSLGQHKNWGESAMLHGYGALYRCELAEAGRRFTHVVDAARELRDHFAEIWGLCGQAHLELRTGGDPAPHYAALSGLAPAMARLVDPNTEVLFRGNLAWLAARLGRPAEALDAIVGCQRAARSASMLSVYTINGFVGQLMALTELAAAHAAPATEVDAVARSVRRDFARIARPFAAAKPYRLYCEGRWLQVGGDVTRARAVLAKALTFLPSRVDRAAFVASFTG